MSPERFILGVDGGGTKTEAWLALATSAGDAPIRVLGRGQAGSSNARITGLKTATSHLEQAIVAAFTDAGVTRQTVATVCLALAGADREQDRAEFRQWSEQQSIAEHTIVTNDALPVLYVSHREGIGIALIVGTGSFAIGRDPSGNMVRCGGWGPLFGDEGSGYAIAIAALQAAARAADGRGPETGLLPALLKHYQLERAEQLISAVYAPGVDRASLAQLAELVFQLADDTDDVARRILRLACDQLTELVTTVAGQLRWETPVTLALTGGVLLRQTAFRQEMCTAIRAALPEVQDVAVVAQPVQGALRIAASSHA